MDIWEKHSQSKNWSLMDASQLRHWVDFFQCLVEVGHYKQNELADHIAYFAIYMPFVREECSRFLQQWNVRKIRVQKECLHVTSGQPWDLYENAKSRAEERLMVPYPEVVDKLAREFEAYDIDEYMP